MFCGVDTHPDTHPNRRHQHEVDQKNEGRRNRKREKRPRKANENTKSDSNHRLPLARHLPIAIELSPKSSTPNGNSSRSSSTLWKRVPNRFASSLITTAPTNVFQTSYILSFSLNISSRYAISTLIFSKRSKPASRSRKRPSRRLSKKSRRSSRCTGSTALSTRKRQTSSTK